MLFAVNIDGTGFKTVHDFTATPLPNYTNSDGAGPDGGVVLSDNTLYGMTTSGGSSGSGTVFAVNIDGTGFKTLHSFAAHGQTFARGYNASTNIDGTGAGGLVLSGSTLYGVTGSGGPAGDGTIFKINTDGSGFTTLYYFTALQKALQNTNTAGVYQYTNSDGSGPNSLILSGNILYGTAGGGGTGGSGTIFSISLLTPSPQLTITPVGQNIILTWSTNATGFTLQSTTNLSSPLWITNLPAEAIVDGQNAVTTPISATQQFFRLAQ
jgi:uncharacterized repeat protein (TIGR03803 family)